MTFRHATSADYALLADLNHQLIRDEGHRNRMTVPELDQRMRGWLSSEYAAAIFEDGKEVVAYALYREQAEESICGSSSSCATGGGKASAVRLRDSAYQSLGPAEAAHGDVLVQNAAAIAFWRAVGYRTIASRWKSAWGIVVTGLKRTAVPDGARRHDQGCRVAIAEEPATLLSMNRRLVSAALPVWRLPR